MLQVDFGGYCNGAFDVTALTAGVIAVIGQAASVAGHVLQPVPPAWSVAHELHPQPAGRRSSKLDQSNKLWTYALEFLSGT